MPVMLNAVLADYPNGLEPKGLTDEIARRWNWPDVGLNNLASSCWRLCKKGRLAKDEGSSLYRLLKRMRRLTEVLASDRQRPFCSNPQRKAVKPVREVVDENNMSKAHISIKGGGYGGCQGAFARLPPGVRTPPASTKGARFMYCNAIQSSESGRGPAMPSA